MPDDRYPGAGNVALLCEGDLAGYEASFFRRWAPRDTLLVDIWPCGTGQAIVGISDAIGRERPVCIVLDRDFRSLEEATEDCKRDRKSREDRGIHVLGWRAWARNEVENYFLDEQILIPTLAAAFGCKEDDVRAALDEVLRALVPYQAVELAAYRARRRWMKLDPAPVLPNLGEVRRKPSWSDRDGVPRVPEANAIADKLEENAKTVEDRFRAEFAQSVVKEFREAIAEWTDLALAPWREDWCGKEILSWIRVTLSARFGFANGKKYHWDDLSRPAWEKQDREIERALHRDFVGALLASLTDKTASENVQQEFERIRGDLRLWHQKELPQP
jgi:hypothetical protein